MKHFDDLYHELVIFKRKVDTAYTMALRYHYLNATVVPYSRPEKVTDVITRLMTVHTIDEHENYFFCDREVDGLLQVLTAWITSEYPTLDKNDKWTNAVGANAGIWSIEETLNIIDDARSHKFEFIVSNGEILYHELLTDPSQYDIK